MAFEPDFPSEHPETLLFLIWETRPSSTETVIRILVSASVVASRFRRRANPPPGLTEVRKKSRWPIAMAGPLGDGLRPRLITSAMFDCFDHSLPPLKTI